MKPILGMRLATYVTAIVLTIMLALDIFDRLRTESQEPAETTVAQVWQA